MHDRPHPAQIAALAGAVATPPTQRRSSQQCSTARSLQNIIAKDPLTCCSDATSSKHGCTRPGGHLRQAWHKPVTGLSAQLRQAWQKTVKIYPLPWHARLGAKKRGRALPSGGRPEKTVRWRAWGRRAHALRALRPVLPQRKGWSRAVSRAPTATAIPGRDGRASPHRHMHSGKVQASPGRAENCNPQCKLARHAALQAGRRQTGIIRRYQRPAQAQA